MASSLRHPCHLQGSHTKLSGMGPDPWASLPAVKVTFC